MKKAYYLFNPGRMSRKDNTLQFDPEGDDPLARPRYLPIHGISALYIFGSIDANSALFNYLGQQHIPVHFFDYYKHYTGSFAPREYLLAGQMLIAQAEAYRITKRRLAIAASFVDAAMSNMVRNLRYYVNRDKPVSHQLAQLLENQAMLKDAQDISQLMGLEGNSRHIYYQAFDHIVDGYSWEGRKRQPPTNELNALVSFGNSLCYTLCLDAIYNSQLNPTISFLHEPGYRRFSLALDISEIFKPILVDRLIFRVCNRKEIREQHFEHIDKACFLSTTGRKTFIQKWEERLQTSIKHRTLNREVSYRHLVRLECYKLAKYILGIEKEYESFKIWW